MKRWHKVVIGIGITVVLLVAIGTFAWFRLQNFFYPTAPPMPAVVVESMPDILARLDGILKTNAPHVLNSLQPGLSSDEVSKLEVRYKVKLSEDIKLIYQWHDGSPQNTNIAGGDFIPGHRFLPLQEALAERAALASNEGPMVQKFTYRLLAGHRDSWISLFADGAGDGYWYDPMRSPREGSVFFNFAEDGSYTFFPSAKNLMAGIAKCYEQGVFRVKTGTSPPELDADFKQAEKIWAEFGANHD